MIYTTLDSDEKIITQCKRWENIPSIAVDFEGEYNLHIYGEHLCLIQIYDTEGFYIIDPRSGQVSKKGLETFFSLSTEKIWFDIQGDAALIYKVYGLKISNVYDVRVPAKILGYNGNLLGLEKEYLGVEVNINKKKNQQANWLKRPIDVDLMEYALLDVKYLHQLKSVLSSIIAKEGLGRSVEEAMKRVMAVKEPTPGWKNICRWRDLKKWERVYVRNVYIARDKIARSFNVPASRVMDKHHVVSLALDPPKTQAELHKRLSGEPQRFQRLLEENIQKALEKSRKEINEGES